MPSILVTGGCGFIGSNFVRFILETDPDVTVVNFDALSYAGNLANLADLASHPRYRFIRGDMTDRLAVRAALGQGIQAVVNFAAESHVDRSILDSGPFVHTNVLGTQVLLDAAREFAVERFVQVSTDEVYGSLGPTGAFTGVHAAGPQQPLRRQQGGRRSAGSQLRPHLRPAGADHALLEQLRALPVSRETDPAVHHQPACDDQPVPVYGDGMNVRDWIHVRDHCAAVAAVWRKGKPGEVYNIGGRCEKTNLELTHTLLELLGKPKTLIRYVPDRPGHDRRYAIDCSRIENELGWRPAVPFEQGLRETIAWYKANPAWIDQVRSGEYRKYYELQYATLATP